MGAVRIRALAGGVAVTGLTSFALMMPATALGQVVTSASVTESAASESATFESATLESAASSQCQVVPTDVAPSASPSTPEGTGTTAPAPAPSGSAPAQADSDQAAANPRGTGRTVHQRHRLRGKRQTGAGGQLYRAGLGAERASQRGAGDAERRAVRPGKPTFTWPVRAPVARARSRAVVGSLDTDVTPSSFQLQAQIPADVAAGTTVTLTAAASAAASPPMIALPEAAASVSVAAAPAPAPSHSPAPSPSRTPGHSPAPTHTPGSQRPTPTPTGHPTGLPATPPASTPALGPIPRSPFDPFAPVTAVASRHPRQHHDGDKPGQHRRHPAARSPRCPLPRPRRVVIRAELPPPTSPRTPTAGILQDRRRASSPSSCRRPRRRPWAGSSSRSSSR